MCHPSRLLPPTSTVGLLLRSLLLSGSLLIPAAAAAQTQPVLVPGAEVRVTARGERSVYRVLRVDADTVHLSGARSDLQIPVSAISKVEIPRTRTRGQQVAHDMGILSLVGAVAGAVIGYADGDDPAGCWLFCMSAEEKALMGGATMGVVGAGVGAIAGLVRDPGTTWRSVPLEDLAVRVEPSAGGVGLAFSWTP